MSYVVQLDAGSLSEFGVQTKYLDCKGNLVGNALPWRLHLIPKFEILWRVVKSIAVLVMDIFAFTKFTPKNSRHDYSVFERLAATAKMQPPVSGRVDVPSGVYGSPTTPFITAFARAKTLLPVVVAVFSVFRVKKLMFLRFTAEIALKSRGWTFVHEAQLAPAGILVKEIV